MADDDRNSIVEYADLAIIDLAKAGTPEGRAELSVEVRNAMTTQGFFYAINSGYEPTQVSLSYYNYILTDRCITVKTERIFDIADVPFARVSPEEKQTYAGQMKETGSYQGYKLRQYWVGFSVSTF